MVTLLPTADLVDVPSCRVLALGMPTAEPLGGTAAPVAGPLEGTAVPATGLLRGVAVPTTRVRTDVHGVVGLPAVDVSPLPRGAPV